MRPIRPDERILAGSAAVLHAVVRDQHGEPDDTVTGVTVSVTRADGSVVVASGTPATDEGASNPGGWTISLTRAQTASLDWLTATWTASGVTVEQTLHEVAGGTYFTVRELRGLFPSLTPDKASDEQIRKARSEIEDLVEEMTGVAWVPRYARVRVDGTGTNRLLMPYQRIRQVRSVRVYDDAATYTAFSAAELADVQVDGVELVRQTLGVFPAGEQNIVVELEHGCDTLPQDLRRELLTLARHRLNAAASGVPDRTLSWTTPEGETHRIAVPGVGRWTTGIPDVDEALRRYDHRVPGVA